MSVCVSALCAHGVLHACECVFCEISHARISEHIQNVNTLCTLLSPGVKTAAPIQNIISAKSFCYSFFLCMHFFTLSIDVSQNMKTCLPK